LYQHFFTSFKTLYFLNVFLVKANQKEAQAEEKLGSK